MGKAFSSTFRRRLHGVSAPEAPLVCLEITHDDLTPPIRVVNDNQDLVSNGATFQGLAFRIALPDDPDKQMPRAQLAIDNVGRGPDGNSLADWLERSGGGKGARVRIMLLLRSAPDHIEWETTMDLADVLLTFYEASGELQYQDILNRPFVQIAYRPDTSPALF